MKGFVKRLELLTGFVVPAELGYDDIVATAITRADLQRRRPWNQREHRADQRTRGGKWPTAPVSEEYDFVDLVWHEQEFREGTSFTYVVRDAEGAYLGCCYLYPMGGRTELTQELLAHDVDVSWWVTPEAYARGYYEKVHRALRAWLAAQLPFSSPYYSNAEIPATDTDTAPTYPKVLVRSEQSSGRIGVIESVMPAGAAGPPLHTHDFDEAFYVLEGELTFRLDGGLVRVAAGQLAFAPAASHTPSPIADRRRPVS